MRFTGRATATRPRPAARRLSAALAAAALAAFSALTVRPPFEVAGRAGASEERSIEKTEWPGEPIKIEEVKVKGRPVGLGAKFTEEDDWLSGLTIKVKNISDRPVVFLDVALVFPRPDAREPAASDHLLYGRYPLAPGQAAPEAPAVGQPPLQPGATAELALTDYEGTRRFLDQTNYPAAVTRLEIEISDVYFDQNTKWSGGQIFRRDPRNPDGWIGERGRGRASRTQAPARDRVAG